MPSARRLAVASRIWKFLPLTATGSMSSWRMVEFCGLNQQPLRRHP